MYDQEKMEIQLIFQENISFYFTKIREAAFFYFFMAVPLRGPGGGKGLAIKFFYFPIFFAI